MTDKIHDQAFKLLMEILQNHRRNGSPFDTNTNQLIQRYRDKLAECGLLSNVGGAEDVEDYLERGWYILYNFVRDQSDKSTQVQVSLDFRNQVEKNASVYLCARKNIKIPCSGCTLGQQ